MKGLTTNMETGHIVPIRVLSPSFVYFRYPEWSPSVCARLHKFGYNQTNIAGLIRTHYHQLPRWCRGNAFAFYREVSAWIPVAGLFKTTFHEKWAIKAPYRVLIKLLLTTHDEQITKGNHKHKTKKGKF